MRIKAVFASEFESDGKCVFDHICTLVPSSTTELSGRWKNSTTPPELRVMAENSFSRHCAMPPPGVDTTVSRLKK
jgi:hypothetical protein